MATIKKNKITAKKSKAVGRYKLGGSPTDPPPGTTISTEPSKPILTPEEKAEAKAEAAAAAKKAEEARIAGLSNRQFRKEKKGVRRNVTLEDEKTGKNKGNFAKGVGTFFTSAASALGIASGVKELLKKPEKKTGKIGGVIKTSTYKSGGTTKKIVKKPLRKAQDGMYTETTPGQISTDESMPTRPMSMVPTINRGTTISTGKKGIIVKKTGGRATKTTYKTGGMVNANAKLVAAKTVKKPAKPRSIAPKKAIPKAKYGMTMTKMKKR